MILLEELAHLLCMDVLFKQLYKSALRFLGIRLRSEKEMRRKLQEWLRKQEEMEQEEKQLMEDKIIAQLVKDRFLDDERFTREWISSRLRSKPRGEVLIRMELLQKGVERDLIDQVFESIEQEQEDVEENGEGMMFKSAMKLGEKYARKYEGLELREARYKLSTALARKGFEMGLIKRVVDALLTRG